MTRSVTKRGPMGSERGCHVSYILGRHVKRDAARTVKNHLRTGSSRLYVTKDRALEEQTGRTEPAWLKGRVGRDLRYVTVVTPCRVVTARQWGAGRSVTGEVNSKSFTSPVTEPCHTRDPQTPMVINQGMCWVSRLASQIAMGYRVRGLSYGSAHVSPLAKREALLWLRIGG